jgi:hypothetical protein
MDCCRQAPKFHNIPPGLGTSFERDRIVEARKAARNSQLKISEPENLISIGRETNKTPICRQ